MKHLQVQAFFDKTLGHEKQTRAILAALAKLTPLNISEIVPRKRTVAILFRYLLRLVFPGLSASEADPVKGHPDLIIGTGSNCHLPMLLAASQDPSTKTVTCMTPEKFLLPRFDLCIVPTHDRVEDRENVLKTLGPPCPASDMKMHKDNMGLILIGGTDHKSHYWQTSDVIEQVRKLISKSEVSWTISSSPRTPEDTVTALANLCANSENAEFFKSEETPDGWVEEQYANNNIAWVTADSISMVYEALSAGCKVGVLSVNWKKTDNKFQRGLTALSGKSLITSYDDWLDGKTLTTGQTSFNEAERCAREILERWWPERL